MPKQEIIYKNGDSYQGQTKDTQLSGRGVYKFKNGSVYQGQFKNNAFSGKGKLKDAFNNLFIVGQFQDNFPHGLVRITYSDQSIYEGPVYRGLRQGKGSYYYPVSSQILQKQYNGKFKDDYYQGQGELLYENGSVYKGNFSKNVFQGNGQLKTNQFTYLGKFKQGLISGQGSIKYKSGQSYDGQFQDNLKHGFGRYIYDDQTIYQGRWIKDKKHGKGILKFKNGNTFEGQFQDDFYKGQGVLKFSDDQFIKKDLTKKGQNKNNANTERNWQMIGQFQQSLYNGPAKIMNKKFEIQIQGLYRNGVKNGVFLIQKMNKYGKKVTYRGQFVNGKQNVYTVSYSQRF